MAKKKLQDLLGFFVELPEGEKEQELEPNSDEMKALERMLGDNPPPSNPPTPSASPSVIVDPQVVSESVNEMSFEKVYADVCQSPVSIFKVEELINSDPQLQNYQNSIKAHMISIVLKQLGSSIEEVLQDAVQKDQALDQLNAMWHVQTKERIASNTRRVESLRQELEEFAQRKQTEIDQILEDNLQAQSDLTTKVQAKLKEEKRIHDLVSIFKPMGENPITLGDVKPPEKPVEINTEGTEALNEAQTAS